MQLTDNDALIVIDVQRDFLPGGSLGVPDGDAVVPVLNEYVRRFRDAELPVVATRDWHPPDHCSFAEQGGPWPPHCVRNSPGAEFAGGLRLPEETLVVSKATEPDAEAYSGFEGTGLAPLLRESGIHRLFVGGLATDYCVLATVSDAVAAGFDVVLLADAVRAVEVASGDGEKAMRSMRELGVAEIELPELEVNGSPDR
jgi:nicotinamidase/pyrazinamidase